MFVTIVLASLLVDGLFSAAGLVPDARPTRADIFGHIKVDYKLVTNILGVLVFLTLFALTVRRGATDPVCGMKIDKARAIRLEVEGETLYFCSEDCASAARRKELPHSALTT